MASSSSAIGILGGTFDPIHYGHLRPALEVQEALALAEIRFVPCRIPAHRGPPAITAEQRLELVRLATAGQPGFVVDDRELHRPGTSYMVDTLSALRAEFANAPLCLLVGGDAFRELPTWHRWQELARLAHLVVMQRPGASLDLPPTLNAFIAPRLVRDVAALHRSPAGSVLFQPVTQLAISATRIRALLGSGQAARYLLPDAVLVAIHERAWYQTPSAIAPAI